PREHAGGHATGRLREPPLKPLAAASSRATHLYGSLSLLFELVDTGHGARTEPSGDGPARHGGEGLVFESLQADLFRPDRTSLINEVKLGNAALQAVLERLLLSKEKRGRDRGFISYVALGINQLGAVYETLMSYTGSFAHEELVEVAKNGDPSD